MEAIRKIVEFDAEGNLKISMGKDFSNKKAEVVFLFEEDGVPEKDWMQLAMKGGAFDFWNDPAEDIYTLEDGTPYKK